MRDVDVGEDEEAGVAGDQVQPGMAGGGVPAEVGVAGGAFPGRGGEAERGGVPVTGTAGNSSSGR